MLGVQELLPASVALTEITYLEQLVVLVLLRVPRVLVHLHVLAALMEITCLLRQFVRLALHLVSGVQGQLPASAALMESIYPERLVRLVLHHVPHVQVHLHA